eukprot:SAG22_NODE_10110_length_552_cov_1.571744_1_plen_34_part_10
MPENQVHLPASIFWKTVCTSATLIVTRPRGDMVW